MPEIITRDEYRSKRKHQYAGTKKALDAPDWPASHWVMRNVNGGTRLVPVQLESLAAERARKA